jgi:hypothetical protein
MKNITLKSIFDFIDFLDKNKENHISNCLPLINELNELDEKRGALEPDLRYDDKIEFEKIQNELSIKSELLESGFTKPILDKLEKLGIWNGEKRFDSIYENISKSLNEIKNSATEKDVIKIKEYALKYSKYRIETNTDFIFLTTCFHYFEKGTFKLFDFFVDDSITEYNELKKQRKKNMSSWNIILNGKKIIVNPIDDFEKLKKHRDLILLNKVEAEIEKRKSNGLNTTNEDKLYIKNNLLIKELETATNWLKNQTEILNITELDKYINYINTEIEKTKKIDLTTIKPETKTNTLKLKLEEYGFFELIKVEQLTKPNQHRLVELISTNDLPYSIAMLEYLGFLKHLENEYFKIKDKLHKAVAELFKVDARTVKGNINVLNEFSNEKRERYTADKQKQIVIKNYQELK